MTKCLTLLLVLSTSYLSSNALAADACVELYRHSLYDEFSNSKSSLSYKATKEAFCKADVTKTDSKQEADTGASYGLISGYGNFSNEEKKSIQSTFCKDDEALSILKTNEKVFIRTLNPAALKAATECLKAENTGLQFTVDGDDEDKFTASLFYSARAGGAAYQEINYKNITSPGLSCKGVLANVAPNTKITSTVRTMVCERMVPQAKPNGQAEEPHFLDNGVAVVISTTAGALKASLPRKLNPRYVAPVATIEIAGNWNSRGQPTPLLAQIASAGDGNYKFTNEFGSVVSGKRNDENNVEVTGAWGHLIGRLQYKATLLLWTNGTWWSRSNFDGISGEQVRSLVGPWYFAGMGTSVGGSDQTPVFYNEHGTGSQGKLEDDTHILGYGLKAKLLSGGKTILWSNGTYWNR